jgi:hypothetical protein
MITTVFAFGQPSDTEKKTFPEGLIGNDANQIN